MHCWWGPGGEVVWCPPSLTSPVLQPPGRWAVLGRGWWQGQSQPGHPQVPPQSWLVPDQGGSVPSARGWLDPSESTAPEPRAIMCMGDLGEAYPWSFSWLSSFSQSLLQGCTGMPCQSPAWSLRLFPVGQNNPRYRLTSFWLCEPTQHDDPPLTTNPFQCEKYQWLGSGILH